MSSEQQVRSASPQSPSSFDAYLDKRYQILATPCPRLTADKGGWAKLIPYFTSDTPQRFRFTYEFPRNCMRLFTLQTARARPRPAVRCPCLKEPESTGCFDGTHYMFKHDRGVGAGDETSSSDGEEASDALKYAALKDVRSAKPPESWKPFRVWKTPQRTARLMGEGVQLLFYLGAGKTEHKGGKEEDVESGGGGEWGDSEEESEED